MRTDQIIAALTAQEPPPLATTSFLDRPGFYAWWASPTRLSDASPLIPPVHPTASCKWALLYVGIAPKRPSSDGPDRTLADRVQGDHRNGSIGNSTFRQSLAALLIGLLDLRPKRGYDRSRIENETALSDWIEEHCRVTMAECPTPWTVEDEVIRLMRPPLNLKPGYHEFRRQVGKARKTLRELCGVGSQTD